MTDFEVRNWTPEFFRANETKCRSILEISDNLSDIPSLNSYSLDNVRHGQVVRFRGMIQDMHDPEYYFKDFSVKNKKTGETKMQSGMYMDSGKCLIEENEIVDVDSNKNEMAERQTWIVVSIPSLNAWAKEKSRMSSPTVKNSSSGTKREISDVESMDCSEPEKKKEKSDEKRNEGNSVAESSKSFLSREHLLNFPIPCDDGKACIVKIYDEKMSMKLNEIVEIIGFVSLDPDLGRVQASRETEEELEIRTHNPPTSLIPRLHAIKINVDSCVRHDATKFSIFGKAESVRSDLHMVLSQLLFGDTLAADYLICHLISGVYLRKDDLCLGPFPLNITNFPTSKEQMFISNLYEVLSSLVPKSYYFECTLDTLNESSLIPKKDYDCNRLTSGILQLSKNTHLVIDETHLTTGQVTAMGKKNYEAITKIIQFQKINYDFKYFTMEYDTDIPVLILSPTKSFIPCPTQIVLKPDDESENLYPNILEAASHYLRDEEKLSNIREYLKILRNSDFEFEEDISEIIQKEFVELRQRIKNFGPDNLHSLMVLARLMSLSRGKNTLSVEDWKETVQMELERIERIPQRKT